jgi:hypothetical protein
MLTVDVSFLPYLDMNESHEAVNHFQCQTCGSHSRACPGCRDLVQQLQDSCQTKKQHEIECLQGCVEQRADTYEELLLDDELLDELLDDELDDEELDELDDDELDDELLEL